MLGISQYKYYRMNVRGGKERKVRDGQGVGRKEGGAERIPPLAETSLTRVGAIMIPYQYLPSIEQDVT